MQKLRYAIFYWKLFSIYRSHGKWSIEFTTCVETQNLAEYCFQCSNQTIRCRTAIQKLSRHDQVSLLRLHFERYFSPSSAWVYTTVLERWTLRFGSDKNRKLKVKLWWVGARKRKRRAFYVQLILSKENYFQISVLFQCIVHWVHFQNIHTFTYEKT